ncbi:MAG: ABC transporter ATP-binding protein [Acidobacteria bacterium]|nr:ABC transporter ATP-binding protein [Acidobacteriota bacterium]
MFKIRHLTKSYGDRTVIEDVSFDILEGESFVILGRSGTGKSVTLRQLNGLEKPDAGFVEFDGVNISTLSEQQLYPIRKRIGMLFQGGALFDSLDVYENIAFPLREHTDLDEEAIAATVEDRLAMVRLHGIERLPPSSLSGGMKKRVALARSLALKPQVMLFDEPTTGLDPMTSASIGELIRGAQRTLGVTSVIVTHDLPLTHKVADRIAFLDGGRFRFTGSLDEALEADDPLLRAFLEGREEEEADVA